MWQTQDNYILRPVGGTVVPIPVGLDSKTPYDTEIYG